MTNASAKKKGRRAVQEIRDALLVRFSPHVGPDDIIIPTGSAGGEDLKLSPYARDKFPFTVECKNVESISIWACLKQAESHAEGTAHIPLLAFRRNHSKMYVALSFEDFMRVACPTREQ